MKKQIGYKYRRYTITIYRSEYGDYYASIDDQHGRWFDSVPYKHDIESVKLAAENLIDAKKLMKKG